MTQEELASRTGLTREYISLLELNKRMPTIQVFVWLCKALGVSHSRMIEEIDWPPPAGAAKASGAKAVRSTKRATR